MHVSAVCSEKWKIAMRDLILHLVFLVALTHAKDYCSVCIDHTMCRFGDETGRRCGKNSEGGVTDSDIQTILDLHNGYRSKVAVGSETRGTPGPQPAAANMQALVWDRQLAEVAQRWADQCTFKHDKCRDDTRFSVGQNIYYSSGIVASNWTRAVELWYEEVIHANASQIGSYSYDNATSHYAQLAWATSRYVGCARRSYAGLYRPRGSPPLEYVLGEARSGDVGANNETETAGYFGNDVRKIDLVAGARGAITSKSSATHRATGSQSVNGQQVKQQPGYFGQPIVFDPSAAQGAVTSHSSDKKPSVTNPPVSSVNVGVKPVYVLNVRPQLNIPSIAYPIYKPVYPTYSQYVTYETSYYKSTTESSKDSSNESRSEEDSSEDSFDNRDNVVVPSSLQFKSWTNEGWKMIDYDLSIDQIYICNYGPTGNFINEPIYIAGPPCSKCPPGSDCRNGLCV